MFAGEKEYFTPGHSSDGSGPTALPRSRAANKLRNRNFNVWSVSDDSDPALVQAFHLMQNDSGVKGFAITKLNLLGCGTVVVSGEKLSFFQCPIRKRTFHAMQGA